jgi:hypothetical protein
VLCSVVFGAFAPSVSKLLAASQDITWIEVCIAHGTKPIAIELGTQGSPDAPTITENHCGYCLLQQHSPFVPTASLTWDAVPATSDRLSLGPGGTTIFKRFVRDAHHTRGPPAFS